MPFVQAKCPECGGMLAVDDSKKTANCQFCGEAFIVQEAINNYNTYNTYNTNHNYGEGAVVNVYEDKVKDFVIEAGELMEYHGTSADVVIPYGIVAIGAECFRGLKIKSVVIPDSVTSISSRAFDGCSNLASFIIPNSLKYIGCYAFRSCVSLTSITIPDSVVSIGEEAFWGCTGLTSIVIPDSVTNIGVRAFAVCRNCFSVSISESMKNIGDYAFYDYWKSKGLCTKCGGTFKKGLIGFKCSKCGVHKDY